MAPPTAQGAALEKDAGSNTWAIVYGKTLDIEYNSGQDVIIINDE